MRGVSGAWPPSPLQRVVLGHHHLLVGLVAVGFVVRFWHADAMALWVDEAISARAAQGILLRGVPAMERFGEGLYLYERGPLHSYLVAASFGVFGVSTLTARLPGILFGVALIPLTYRLGAATTNRRVGLYAAGILTFHPWMIEVSRYTRFYAEFQTLFVLTLVAYLGWLRRGGTDGSGLLTPLRSSRQTRVPLSVGTEAESSRSGFGASLLYLLLLVVTVIAAYFTHPFYLLIVGILGAFTTVQFVSVSRLHSVSDPRLVLGLVALPLVLVMGLATGLVPSTILELLAPANYTGVDAAWIFRYLATHDPRLLYASVAGLIVLTGRFVMKPRGHPDFLVFCYGATFLALSFGLPILVEEIHPRYFSPLLPLIIIAAAVAIDWGVQFVLRHQDTRKLLARTTGPVEPQQLATGLVLATVLVGTASAAAPHFSADGYQADPTYESLVNDHDFRGPAQFVLEQSSGHVTVYVRPLNTPTFYLDWERGGVNTIRYLSTPEHVAVERWADETHVIRNLDELKQRVRADAERGEVWFVVKDWVAADRGDWVRARSTRVDRGWKGATVYEYRGDDIAILAPGEAGWEEAVVSVEGNAFGMPGFLVLGRQADSDVTWGAQTAGERGEVVLRSDIRSESPVLSTRVFGAGGDRYVTIYYSTDGRSWTEAVHHERGEWAVYDISLDGIGPADETIYLRVVGGSTESDLGGLVDYLRLEPAGLGEADA